MTPRDKAIKLLNENGYFFDGHGAKHDKYYNAELHATITLKRHDVSENTVDYLRQEIRRNARRLSK